MMVMWLCFSVVECPHVSLTLSFAVFTFHLSLEGPSWFFSSLPCTISPVSYLMRSDMGKMLPHIFHSFSFCFLPFHCRTCVTLFVDDVDVWYIG
jgi:hypothetical protein